MANEPTHLKPSADGSLHIPAELLRQAGLEGGKSVLLHVGVSRLTLLSPLDPRVLFEAFTNKTKEALGDLNGELRMSDGRTISEYLALSEGQRAALWEDAFRFVMEELEKEPEQDASANYVLAGQRHRARRV